AFHASIGLIVSSVNADTQTHKLSLPFAMQELDIFGPCPSDIWSFIRYSQDSKADDKVRKYDIDLCDENGNICVRMKGASIRALEGEHSSASKTNAAENAAHPPVGHTMMIPVWEPISADAEDDLPAFEERAVLIGGSEDDRRLIKQHDSKITVLDVQSTDDISAISNKLQACGSIDHVIWIAPSRQLNIMSEDMFIEDQEKNVLHVFKIVKALLQSGYGDKAVTWSLVTVQAQPVVQHESINPSHASIHGLAGTMAKEYPNWKIRLLDLEEDCVWPIKQMFTLPADRHGHAWAYRNQQWHQQELIPFQHSPSNSTLYKTGGVYVVIGGAGYIGEAWSEYMIRSYQAQIIWIGRSPLNDANQAKLDRLAYVGPMPHYIAADAADVNSLQQAYEKVKERYAHIHGVVHSAMNLSEQSLENMRLEEFRSGLSAKVDVSVC
ncbi:SDR family oxidoreductase, partial [Bacillus wiedmannii]|uniref:SDR family NAD(P)-dependent oxidoreductase n=1 Tax=Bacillus wiedmannii TaxID=1890302 RepID=UPI003CF3212E